MTSVLNGVRHWIWPLLAGLTVILILLLLLSPADRTLGQTVKLVYLHGALVRTATVLFAASLPVNLAALTGGRRSWPAWGKALAWVAVVIWLVHTLFSMVTTYATWGVFVAWFEPRTRFTVALAAVGLVILAVARLVDGVRFSALAFALLAGLALGLARGLGTVQHPLNAIGSSPSYAIRASYVAILLVSLTIGVLLVIWLQARLAPGR